MCRTEVLIQNERAVEQDVSAFERTIRRKKSRVRNLNEKNSPLFFLVVSKKFFKYIRIIMYYDYDGH